MTDLKKIGRLFAALIIVLSAALALPLQSLAGKPTISGTITVYNPGGYKMQLRRDDGVVKTIVMRQGCQFMMNGQKVSCNAFRPNMRVCVRICGSVMDNPLQCDLVADYMSSKNVVARHAGTPNPTQVGGFASTGGPASNMAAILPNMTNVTPNISGPLGLGGNFPVDNTNFPQGNPANAAQGADPAIQGQAGSDAALADPSNPYKQGTAAPGAVQPIGTTVGQGQYPGGFMPGVGNPANMGMNTNPYDPYASGSNSSLSSILNLDDDKDKDKDDGFMRSPSNGPFSMQTANFLGRIIAADARTRTITVLPDGQNQNVQIILPQMVNPVNAQTGQLVQIKDLQPGMAIAVQGLANTAGIIEARSIRVAR